MRQLDPTRPGESHPVARPDGRPPTRLRVGARTTMAVRTGRAVSRLSRAFGLGEGAVIGGRVALRVDRNALRNLTTGRRVVLVTGTNGKTTTTLMIASALRAVLGRVVSNGTGANMPEGHTHALGGDLFAREAVLEVDELWVPKVADQVDPAMVVLLNLSRDQLDRTEEIRAVARTVAEAFTAHPEMAVVANVDDPWVVSAAVNAARPVWVSAGLSWSGDAACCPACGGRLSREGLDWWCRCGLRRPEPAWESGADVVTGPDGFTGALSLALPGAANRANAVMSLAAAYALGCPADPVVTALGEVRDVNGRYRRLGLGGRSARLLLAKNPAGWAATLELLSDATEAVVLVVNSGEADGRDVSWLWDVPFESLRGRQVVASGDRATDLSVRLAYAEVEHTVVPDPVEAVAMSSAEPDVVANYTAFHALRWRATW